MTSLVAAAAAWVASRAAAVAARVGYAVVEGAAFAYSKPSGVLLVVAELATFALLAGPRAPLRVAVGTLFAAGTLRAIQALLASFRHPDGRSVRLEDLTGLSSVWDWEPPADDAQQASGAWHTLRQLALTAERMRAENPAIAGLLNQPGLAASELAHKLYYFYITPDEPLLDAQTVAALQAAAAVEDAVVAVQSEQAEAPGQDDAASTEQAPAGNTIAVTVGGGVQPVQAGLKAQLAYYRSIACMLYDYSTDAALGEQLQQRGYTLLCASYCADLASSCPAYFLAISEERQEVMLVIRGTFSPQDAFVDLMANGAAFDEPAGICAMDGDKAGGLQAQQPQQQQPQEAARLCGYCHAGMGRAATFLGRKFGPLLRPLYAEGLRVTLVGHSLGAGVASLLAVYLRNRGLGAGRLQCWAYETPACMDLPLAEACADVVTSLVNRDDMVPRMCIRSFAGLLEELAAFDWRRAAADAAAASAADGGASTRSGSAVSEHLAALLVWVLGPGGKAGTRSGATSDDGSSLSGAGSSLLQGSAGDLKAQAEQEGDSSLSRLGSAGFQRQYNAHVPGRVVLVCPLPDPSAAADGTSTSPPPATASAGSQGTSGGAASSGDAGAGAYTLAQLPCTHRAVHRLRLGSRMIVDHFIDKPEVVAALGG